MIETLQWAKRVSPQKVNSLYLEHFGTRYSEYRRLWNKSGKDFLPDFPINLDFELIDDCNLRCRHCFRNEEIAKKMGLIINTGARFSLALFKKIIDEGSQHGLQAVNLGFSGECFLNPDLMEFIRLASQGGILDIRLLTNGILITEEMADKLIESALTFLSFSVDAGHPHTYKLLKDKDFFYRLRNIVRHTYQRRLVLKKKFPLIRATFYSSPENQGEEELFFKEFSKCVDFVDFQRFHNMRKSQKRKITIDCRAPFQRLAIFPNGDVSPCCTFFSKKLIVGNAMRTRIKDIWNSEAVQRIREGLIKCKPARVCENCLQTIA